MLSGHDHTYERFAPQTVAGIKDTLRGVTQIVVGTGGAELRGFRTPSANSVARVEGHWSVLKSTLGAVARLNARRPLAAALGHSVV